MKCLIFLLLLALISINGSSQYVRLSGIIDNKDLSPVPFVNIAVSGSYHGTVSNASGEFVLHLPNNLINEKITFSCIGYETYVLLPPHTSNSFTIKLKPLAYEVGEITVMPDSTLRTLIRMAYRKIPDNYPDYSTRSKGFYRAAIKEVDGDYIMLTEAMLDVFKTSYSNKTEGQVKINRSRKYIAPGIDSINNVSFYNGHYIPHWADIVKNRHPIVQASRKYNYELNGLAKIGDRVLYVISFEPVDFETEGYIGKMYIDKATLAFEKFEYHSNEERLKWREKEIFAQLSSKEAKTVVAYAPTAGKYFLKTANFSEVFENNKTGHLLEKVSEYVLVETNHDNAAPIPYPEITPYSVVIAHEAIPYFKSDWRDYPIVGLDENKMLNNKMSDSIFVNTLSDAINAQNRNNKIEKAKRILNILDRFDFEYNFYQYKVNVDQGLFSLCQTNQNSPNDILSHSVSSANYNWGFELAINYKLKKQIGLMYLTSEGLNKGCFLNAHKLGLSFILPVKTYGKQLLLSFQPGYRFQTTMISLGESEYLFRFKNGNLTMTDGKSKVYWGEKSHGIDGRVTLKYQFRRSLWLNVFSGYYHQMHSRTMLRFEDKSGSVFALKNKNIGFNESRLNLNINGMPKVDPLFELNPFYFGFGVVMAF